MTQRVFSAGLVLFVLLVGCAPRTQMMEFTPIVGRSLQQDVAGCRLEVEQQRTPSAYYVIPNTTITAPYYDDARTNELYNLCMQAKGYTPQP